MLHHREAQACLPARLDRTLHDSVGARRRPFVVLTPQMSAQTAANLAACLDQEPLAYYCSSLKVVGATIATLA